MRIAIAGAHGQIALQLIGRLASGGHEIRGLIRNPEHAAEIEAAGARPVVCDLEHAGLSEVDDAVHGCDVVVFAAGAGPGSSAERKLTMDRDGAIKLLQASPGARYLMVSSVGAEDPPTGDDVFSVYLRAKSQADAALIASERDFTIVRPGPLGDEPGTGRVRLGTDAFRERIPREDVAAILAQLIATPGSASRLVLYAGAGDAPVDEAIAALVQP
jgi:nucleoside-diphosphate-sugar epimerase